MIDYANLNSEYESLTDHTKQSMTSVIFRKFRIY